MGDQFKQTYIYDATANTGTYLGIFARSQWISDGCNYTQQTQNTLEAWNIVGDGTAKMLSSVDFGKPNSRIIVSLHMAAHQVWLSAATTVHKLRWDVVENDFILDKTDQTLKELLEQTISRQVGEDVSL